MKLLNLVGMPDFSLEQDLFGICIVDSHLSRCKLKQKVLLLTGSDAQDAMPADLEHILWR